MEGKILYGKITSPKFIAEASLADSFSFDLQRFTEDYAWSIGAGGDSGKLIYATSSSSIASLSIDPTTWKLTTTVLSGGASVVKIDLTFSDASQKNVLDSLNGGTNITTFDASGLTGLPFNFKLNSSSHLTSILGGASSNSIDASAVTSGNLSITGGNANDYLVAGKSGNFYLDGGSGADSLVGGKGADLFIYGGSGADSIFSYGTGADIVSLSAIPGASSVAAVGNNLVISVESSSLTVADYVGSNKLVTVVSGDDKLLYNNDYIMNEGKTAVSLTSSASLYSAASTIISIDGSAANDSANGLKIVGNSQSNSIIGSEHVATTIFGGAGDDFVSLGGASSNASVNVYVYGSGRDSLTSIGSAGKVSLASYNLITDGTALASLGEHKFQLTFDKNNILTFTSQDSINVVGKLNKTPTTTLTYTPSAISVAGGGNGSSITLGSSWTASDGVFDASSYSMVSGAAVSLSNGKTFAIKGGGVSSYMSGSDLVGTSILAGANGDSLVAGAGGASLDNNDKDGVLLIGGSAQDYFLYSSSKATIQNYNYNSDVVSVYGTNAPTTEIGQFSLRSSDSTFNISMGGASHVLTFKNTTAVDIVSVGGNDTLFHYEYDRVIVNNNRVTLGSEYTKNFNANNQSDEYNISSINAAAVNVAKGINITGHADYANSIVSAKFGGKIVGGDGKDTLSAATSTYNNGASLSGLTLDGGAYGDDILIGGASSKDWFIYRGGKDSIGSYSAGQDTIQVIGSDLDMVRNGVTFGSLSSNHDLVLDFGSSDSLTVAGGASSDTTVTIKNGSHTFNYHAGEIVLDSNSVTLTSDYVVVESPYTLDASVTAIDASAVSIGTATVSIKGNDLGNRIIGSEKLANSLLSGAKNDYMSGGEKADVFIYTGGKDTVANYQYSLTGGGDSLVATNFVDNIKSGKVSGSRLIFTGNTSGNVLTFLSDDEAIEKVSLGGGSGYLTKDGRVSNNGKTFNLFSNARGTIDLTTAPYSVAAGDGFTSVNASAVTNQGVTLVAGSLSSAATYILPGNKKRDRFVYAGGAVSISGYDSGKDQINLGTGSINGFSVSGKDVLISVGGYSGGTENDIISIASGKGDNFLIHQGTDKNANFYRKMAFTQSGILTDKASKPTSVTVLSGAASLDAGDLGGGTIKKIYSAGGLSGISILAGDKYNTQFNMANAGTGLSLYGGKKNDKITGSTTGNDLFVYKTDSGTGGKDIITNFTANSDKISLGAGVSLSSAKITARSKNLTFKFNNKNSLALKSDSTISAVTVAGGDSDTTYTFAKNAYSTNSGEVSLTSSYSGTFNTKSTFGSQVATVDGHLASKNLTFKGTKDGETLVGGTKKTTFRGGGGTDSLVGGSGSDVFFYAKNESGTSDIVDFDYSKDKLKIASGTISTITTINGGGGVQFTMKNTSGANVGYFNVKGTATYGKDGTKAPGSAPGANTLIKANNTYYWFADSPVIDQVTVDGGTQPVTLAGAGQLVTSDTKISASKVSGYDVIDLNYSTNLVRAGIAVATSKATLPTKSS